MRSLAASLVGLIDTGAILALIDRSDKWLLAPRPTTIADCRNIRRCHAGAPSRPRGLSLILSLDYDDFETYQFQGRKKFAILPRRTRI